MEHAVCPFIRVAPVQIYIQLRHNFISSAPILRCFGSTSLAHCNASTLNHEAKTSKLLSQDSLHFCCWWGVKYAPPQQISPWCNYGDASNYGAGFICIRFSACLVMKPLTDQEAFCNNSDPASSLLCWAISTDHGCANAKRGGVIFLHGVSFTLSKSSLGQKVLETQNITFEINRFHVDIFL